MWRKTECNFIEVIISAEMQSEADARNKLFYKKFGNKGTHRTNKDRQRTTGYLAEIAVAKIYPWLKFSESHTIDFTFENITFDVKAQGCNTEPSDDFVGTLYAEQAMRTVDFYIFTRVSNDFTRVWITGFISKINFLQKAKLIPAGTKNNNFTYDQARYEIPYNQLIKPSTELAIKNPGF